jgi:hypothetical protein
MEDNNKKKKKRPGLVKIASKFFGLGHNKANGENITIDNEPLDTTSIDNDNSYKSISLQQKLDFEDIIDVLNNELKIEKEKKNLLTFKLELMTNILSVEEREKKTISKRLEAVQHYILNSDQMNKSLSQSLSNFQPSAYITKEDSKEIDNELNHKQIFHGLDIEGAIKRCRNDFEGENKGNIINSFVDIDTRKIIPLWTREEFMIALYKFTTTITRMDTQIIALRFFDGKHVSVPEFLEFFGNTSSRVRIAKASAAAFRLSSELLKLDMSKENISKTNEDKRKFVKSSEGPLKEELNNIESNINENDINIKENISSNNNKIELIEVIELATETPVKQLTKSSSNQISKPNSHIDLTLLDNEKLPTNPPRISSKSNSLLDLTLLDNEENVENKEEMVETKEEIVKNKEDNVVENEVEPTVIKEEQENDKTKETTVLVENNHVNIVSKENIIPTVSKDNDDIFIILHKIELKRDSLPTKSLWSSFGKSFINVSVEYGDDNWKRSTESIEDNKKKISWKLEVGGDNTAVSVNPKINNKLKIKINDKNNKIIGKGFIEIPHDLSTANMNRVLKCVVSYADIKINASPMQIAVTLSRIVVSQSPRVKNEATNKKIANSPVEVLANPNLLFPEGKEEKKEEEKLEINETPVVSTALIDNDIIDNDKIVEINNDNKTIYEEKDSSIVESKNKIKEEIDVNKEKNISTQQGPKKPPRSNSSNQLNLSSELDNKSSNSIIEFDDDNNSANISKDSQSSPVKEAKEKYKNELSNIINDIKVIEEGDDNDDKNNIDEEEAEEDNGVEEFRISDLSISQQSVQVPKLNFSILSEEENGNTTTSIIDIEEEEEKVTNSTNIVDIEDNNIQDIEELDDFDDVESFEEEEEE